MPRKLTKEEFQQKLIDKGITDVKIIGDYIDSHTKTQFECNGCENNCKWDAAPNSVMSGHKSQTHSIKVLKEVNSMPLQEFKKRLRKVRPSLKVIEYDGSVSGPCTVQCKNGHKWHSNDAYRLLKKSSKGDCPYCSGALADLENNSIYVKRNDLVKYFINEDDAKNNTEYSNKTTSVKCPICGYEKEVIIYNFTRQGFSCPICGDNTSIPNKVLRNLMLQLKEQVDFFQFEYSPDWLHGQRLDGYFEIKGKKYAVEMQGAQHFKVSGRFTEDVVQKIKEADQNKRQKCLENNVKEIEINSEYSDILYIQQQIEKSELANILDMSKVNWKEIYINATKNLTEEIIALYNEGKKITQIANELICDRHTVYRALKLANSFGAVDYNPSRKLLPTVVKNIKTKEEKYFDTEVGARRYVRESLNSRICEATFKKCIENQTIIQDTFIAFRNNTLVSNKSV